MSILKNLFEVHRIIVKAQITCYGISQELEEKQCWYDTKPHIWKRSLCGRRWARSLFRAQKLVAEIECLTFLDHTLSTRRGQAKVMAIKSDKHDT